MIDFHNHIVPGVDDGARNLDEAVNMARDAEAQGITEVMATVHRQHPKFEAMNVTDDMVQTAFISLTERLKEEGIRLKLHLAAEVYYQPNLLTLINHPFAVIGGYRNILVEFPVTHLPYSYHEVFQKLLDIGVVPVIAHPERYKPFQQDFSLLRKLFNAGVLVQIDAGSLIGTLGGPSQKLARRIVSKGLAHFIGSDAHNTGRRKFCLAEAYDAARRIMGQDAEILVNHNPHALIYGDEITAFRSNNQFMFSLFSNFINRKKYQG